MASRRGLHWRNGRIADPGFCPPSAVVCRRSRRPQRCGPPPAATRRCSRSSPSVSSRDAYHAFFCRRRLRCIARIRLNRHAHERPTPAAARHRAPMTVGRALVEAPVPRLGELLTTPEPAAVNRSPLLVARHRAHRLDDTGLLRFFDRRCARPPPVLRAPACSSASSTSGVDTARQARHELAALSRAISDGRGALLARAAWLTRFFAALGLADPTEQLPQPGGRRPLLARCRAWRRHRCPSTLRRAQRLRDGTHRGPRALRPPLPRLRTAARRPANDVEVRAATRRR